MYDEQGRYHKLSCPFQHRRMYVSFLIFNFCMIDKVWLGGNSMPDTTIFVTQKELHNQFTGAGYLK